MVNPEENKNNLIDPIRPAEKPKPLFEQFWSKALAMELEDKIRANMKDSIYVGDKRDDVVATRIEREKAFCSVVLNGLEEFMKNHEPEKSVFLWDMQGTLGISHNGFTPRDTLDYLLPFIRSKYRDLKFGLLTDNPMRDIKEYLDDPKMINIKKYIDADKYFSVAETDPKKDAAVLRLKEKARAAGTLNEDGTVETVVLPNGGNRYNIFGTPAHDYSKTLHLLGSEMTPEEKVNIEHLDPLAKKKRIADIIISKGIGVFAVDDLTSQDGVIVKTMITDSPLYY